MSGRAAGLVLLSLLHLACGSDEPPPTTATPVTEMPVAATPVADERPTDESPSETDPLEQLRATLALGKFAEVEASARELWAERADRHGARSPEVAQVLDLLVQTLVRARRINDPETLELAREAVELKESAYDADDVEITVSLNGLAILLRMRGETAEARAIQQRIVAIQETRLGESDPRLGKSLYNLAVLEVMDGDADRALELAERAERILSATLGPDHPEIAVVLDFQGALLRDSARFDQALEAFRSAVAVAEKGHGPDSYRLASPLGHLGLLHLTLGDHDAARETLSRAIEILEATVGEHPDLAAALNGMANVHLRRGHYDEAASMFRRALAINQAAFGAEHSMLGMSIIGLGAVCTRTADHACAREHFARALDIMRRDYGPEHPATLELEINLALALQKMGQYRQARELLEHAIDIAEQLSGTGRQLIWNARTNLSTLLAELGDYHGAKQQQERALESMTRNLGSDHPDVAAGLHNLANLQRSTGELEVALGLLQRALAIQERTSGPLAPTVATTLGSLAGVRSEMDEHEKAAELYRRVVSIHEGTVGREHPLTAEALSRVAATLFDQGRYDEAMHEVERAWAIHEATSGLEDRTAWPCVFEKARILLQTGDHERARELLERSLQQYEAFYGPTHLTVAQVLLPLALAHRRAGDTDTAVDLALRAERIARTQFLRTARSLSEHRALRLGKESLYGVDLALTFLASSAAPSPGTSVERVWDQLIRSRALVLDEMASRHLHWMREGGPGGELREQISDLRSTRSRLARLLLVDPADEPAVEWQTRVEDATKAAEQAETALAEKSAAFRRELSRHRTGLAEVAGALPAESALVAYVRYGRYTTPAADPIQTYAAFVLSSEGASARMVPLGEAESIDALVDAWREKATSEPVELAGHDATDAYRGAGGALREAIWDPLVPGLAGADRVFIVPDGTLHLVSFDTLPLRDGSFLVEGHRLVHYLSTERELAIGANAHGGRGVLLVGAPDYDGRVLEHEEEVEIATDLSETELYRGPVAPCSSLRGMRFERLRGALQEVDGIRSLWETPSNAEPVLSLTGGRAREDAVKRFAGGHRVMHLATHGFSIQGGCDDLASSRTESNPLLLSGLALAGANLRGDLEDAPDAEDGILTAEEIASLDLRGVEWAVLSACETGLGELVDGEGVLGLRRAFDVAGAGTVIMSLWKVQDRATAEWMRALYEHRLAGRSAPEATRRATRDVLEARRAGGRSPHPFFWGAFVAAGDWR